MDEHRHGVRAHADRHPQFPVLARVLAVRNTPIRRLARKRLKVLGSHESIAARRRIGRRRYRRGASGRSHERQQREGE
jgi:hypothetical protein